jgi:hypothetical protein
MAANTLSGINSIIQNDFIDYKDWNGQYQRIQLIYPKRVHISNIYLGQNVPLQFDLHPLGNTPLLTASYYEKANMNFGILPIGQNP